MHIGVEMQEGATLLVLRELAREEYDSPRITRISRMNRIGMSMRFSQLFLVVIKRSQHPCDPCHPWSSTISRSETPAVYGLATQFRQHQLRQSLAKTQKRSNTYPSTVVVATDRPKASVAGTLHFRTSSSRQAMEIR